MSTAPTSPLDVKTIGQHCMVAEIRIQAAREALGRRVPMGLAAQTHLGSADREEMTDPIGSNSTLEGAGQSRTRRRGRTMGSILAGPLDDATLRELVLEHLLE
jgi:hypothetical protein